MAGYTVDTTDPQVVKLWERRIWKTIPFQTTLFNPKYKWARKDGTGLVHLVDDFKKGVGDSITFNLIHEIGGRGARGREVLEGKEQQIKTPTDTMAVDIIRQAGGDWGEINAQRVPYDILEETVQKLVNWHATRQEVAALAHLCGWTADGVSYYVSSGGDQIDGSDLAYTGNNAPTQPNSQYKKYASSKSGGGGDQTTDEGVGGDSTSYLDVEDIDLMVEIAKTLPVPIRPVMYEGKPYYFLFYHPAVGTRFRKPDTDWFALAKDELQGGLIRGNALLTGGTFLHNGVIGVEHNYCSPGVHSSTGAAVANTRRSVFCGAEALAFGKANPRKESGESSDTGYSLKWANWDYDDKRAVAVKSCYGMKCPKFNDIDGTSRDYARIVITSYAQSAIYGS